MNVYKPRPLSDGKVDLHCCLTFISLEEGRRFGMGNQFRGVALDASQFEPYRMKRRQDFPGGETAPLGDLAGIGSNLDPMAWSRHALEVLRPHLGDCIQALPLNFDEGQSAGYSLVNITHVIDALDVAASDIQYFDDGALWRVNTYSFKPELVREQWIFKIPQAPYKAFVTDRFVDRVRQAGLSGFDFELVWSDGNSSQAIPR